MPALEVSIVMPCLNEADTLEACITKATRALCTHHIRGEIIVADNGSTDESPAIAEACIEAQRSAHHCLGIPVEHDDDVDPAKALHQYLGHFNPHDSFGPIGLGLLRFGVRLAFSRRLGGTRM